MKRIKKINAIKCLESLTKQAFSNAKNDKQVQVYKKYYELISKKLKAFEIMKRVVEEGLISLENSKFCGEGKYAIYDIELYHKIYITKDEYELLREELKEYDSKL